MIKILHVQPVHFKCTRESPGFISTVMTNLSHTSTRMHTHTHTCNSYHFGNEMAMRQANEIRYLEKIFKHHICGSMAPSFRFCSWPTLKISMQISQSHREFLLQHRKFVKSIYIQRQFTYWPLQIYTAITLDISSYNIKKSFTRSLHIYKLMWKICQVQ